MAPENVGTADKKRRRRKRKPRTEDFSSDSDSDSSHGSTQDIKETKDDEGDTEMTEQVDDLNIEPEDEDKAPMVHPKTVMPESLKPESDESAFNDYYLQLMTSEFAEDLDKLRQSKDFGDKSLYLLIEALKQGSSMFDLQEREEILKSRK